MTTLLTIALLVFGWLTVVQLVNATYRYLEGRGMATYVPDPAGTDIELRYVGGPCCGEREVITPSDLGLGSDQRLEWGRMGPGTQFVHMYRALVTMKYSIRIGDADVVYMEHVGVYLAVNHIKEDDRNADSDAASRGRNRDRKRA